MSDGSKNHNDFLGDENNDNNNNVGLQEDPREEERIANFSNTRSRANCPTASASCGSTCGTTSCTSSTIDASNAVTLSGSLFCAETEDSSAFCWSLTAENRSTRSISCVSLSLDIRSYQNDQPFVLGPGIFATATYSIVPPASLTGGTINASYAGTGVFYTINALPPGTWLFTVCATFANPQPALVETRILASPFSLRARYAGQCEASVSVAEVVLVSCGDCCNGIPPENAADEPINTMITYSGKGTAGFSVPDVVHNVTSIGFAQTMSTATSATAVVSGLEIAPNVDNIAFRVAQDGFLQNLQVGVQIPAQVVASDGTLTVSVFTADGSLGVAPTFTEQAFSVAFPLTAATIATGTFVQGEDATNQIAVNKGDYVLLGIFYETSGDGVGLVVSLNGSLILT